MKYFYFLLAVCLFSLTACKQQAAPAPKAQEAESAAANASAEKRADDTTANEPSTEVQKNRQAAFFKAVSSETPYKVQEYINEGVDINAKNEKGFTPLELALLENQDTDVARLLIAQGANVNIKDKNDANILIQTAPRLDSMLKVRLLLNSGIDPNAADKSGRTAILSAAPSNTDAGVFLELIAHGADTNARNSDDWTPLDYAVRFNKSPDVIRVLIKYGAHPKDKADARKLTGLLNNNPYLAGKDLDKLILKSI